MFFFHLRLGLPKSLFHVGPHGTILKEFLPSSFLARCLDHFNILDLITLKMLGERYCIVLMGWSLLPNALRPLKIYCAPPNLGITRM